VRVIDDSEGLDGADAGLFVGQFVVAVAVAAAVQAAARRAVVVLGVDFEEVVQHDH